MAHRVTPIFVALSLCAAAAHGAGVTLSGDLGNNFWAAGGQFSAIGAPNITTSFTQTVANGTISGDVIASNPTGFAFSLKVTNVVYTTFTPGVANLTNIMLVATHGFQVGTAGNFFASHSLTGTWSAATGNTAQLDTTVDLNSPLPSNIQQIFLANTAGATSFASSSPAVGGATASPVMTIQTVLRLRIDGIGTTTLPGSADVDVTIVPAPATLGLAGFAGIALTTRRRR